MKKAIAEFAADDVIPERGTATFDVANGALAPSKRH